MKVSGVQCASCDEKLVSMSRHDFHYCGCGSTFVDGGRDYLRFGWMPNVSKPLEIEVEIDD